MNAKIVIGVVLPLLLIIFLTVLASVNTGFSVQEEIVESISLSDIYESGQIDTTIRIADITITNDYFLGKRYDLPHYRICVDDSDGGHSRINAGALQYSEGVYDDGDFIFGEATSYPSSSFGSPSVEVGGNDQLKVRLYLSPSYQFTRHSLPDLVSLYGDYDRLIVYESQSSSYSQYSTTCSGISDETLKDARYITLTA